MAVTDLALEQLLGLTYAEHLAVLDAIATMEAGARHDRDRVMQVFDQRAAWI